MFVIGLIYIYSLTNKLLVLEIYAQFKDFSTELIFYPAQINICLINSDEIKFIVYNLNFYIKKLNLIV